VLRAVLDWLWSQLVPRRLRRFLATRFYGIEPPESWGYVVWGSDGLVIATPEIAAAGMPTRLVAVKRSEYGRPIRGDFDRVPAASKAAGG